MQPDNPSPQTQWPKGVTGLRQSPIAICTETCCCPASNKPLVIKYPPSMASLPLKNSGHGWVVNIPEHMARNTLLSGGPLTESYILEQFHCHWGQDCSCGSEHTIDGKTFAAELHLVHWNKDRFSSFVEAASQDKGLAVLAVFLDVGQETNSEFEKITSLMQEIKYKGEEVTLKDELILQNLLPSDKSFWTYEGSLTTPPFYESVSWLVLKQPIKVTQAQISQFRILCSNSRSDIPSAGEMCIFSNFRAPQDLNERPVSFLK